MLQKIKEFYDEDGELTDIEDEKIYWDTNKNVFRHRFICCDCGKVVMCMCYESLDSAIRDVEVGYDCEACSVANVIRGLDAFDILDIFEAERVSKVKSYIQEITTESAISKYFEGEEFSWSDLSNWDLQELIGWDENDDKLKEFVVALMTEEEKKNEYYEACEGYAEGEICSI